MIFTHKLTIPVTNATLVDRWRLYQQLERWQALRMLLIRAPAGYGKTTLVSRWIMVAGHQGRAAWLSLDESHSDPRVFIQYLAAAIDPLIPGVQVSTQLILRDARTSPDQALNRLLLDVQAALAGDRHILLVLDDLHLAQSTAISTILSAIIERGSPNLHFILISRNALTFPLTGLVARGAIHEIGINDLRFTSAEVGRFFECQNFHGLNDIDLATITAQSEGWVTILRLLSITQSRDSWSDSGNNDRQRDSSWMIEHLVNQALQLQSQLMRRFLLRISILESFSASLCAAVSGMSDVQRMLLLLERTNPFLIALDNRHEWFRYHHLFQEQLQRRLLEVEGETGVRDLHRRAALWMADASHIPEAVRHFRAAGDDRAAADLVVRHIRPVTLNDPVRARQWLDLLPQQEVFGNPVLMVERCRVEALFDNLNLATHIEPAERLLAASTLPEPDIARLQAELLLWRMAAHWARSDFVLTDECARRARQFTRYYDDFALGVFEFMLMHLCVYRSEIAAAKDHATQAIEKFERAGFIVGVIALHRELARHAFQWGDSTTANQHFQALFAHASSDQPGVAYEMMLAYIFAAEQSFWRNDLARARMYHQQAALLTQHLQDPYFTSIVAGTGALYGLTVEESATDTHAYDIPIVLTSSRYRTITQIALLTAAHHFEEAWEMARHLGATLESDPATLTDGLLIAFIQAYVGRGADLDLMKPLLARALDHCRRIGRRFSALRLLMFQAWLEHKLNNPVRTREILSEAASLAHETGYTRVLLDIPDLRGLVGDSNHIAAVARGA